MRALRVLTAALVLAACNDTILEPNPNADRSDGLRRYISGVNWTFSSTDVEMIALGQFDGADTYPLDVNDNAQVVGQYYVETPEGQRARAFVWENGVYTDLGTLGGSVAVAHQISNSGVIVGWSYNAAGERRPAVWINKVIQELPPPAGQAETFGAARAINANGEIVGYYGTSAVKWTASGAQVLGVLAGTAASQAHGVNSVGEVIGAADDPRAFWRWNGGFSTLSLPAGAELSGAMVESGRVYNDAGHLIGTATDEMWNVTAFVVRDGESHTLPHISAESPDGYTVALGINENGDIAGLDLSPEWTWAAVVWPRSGSPVNLGVPPGDMMARANALNNGIFAVGSSYDSDGKAKGVLWRWLVDRTSPVIAGQVQGTLGLNGWYTSDVSVTWTMNDVETGIKSSSGCDATGVSWDAALHSFTCTATNGADLTASATVTFKRDASPPSIEYQNNLRSYTVDQTINIICVPSDATSGIASHTCQNITGDALAFGLGTHTYSASATDNAGLSTTASTSFNVSVTLASLAVLTRRYSTNEGLGEALAKLLLLAEQLRNHRNTVAAEVALRAYVTTVQYQTGHAFSAEHSAILLELAKHFVDTKDSRQKPRAVVRRGWK